MAHDTVTISAPNMASAAFRIVGTAPLVQHKFSTKAREKNRATQEAGSTARSSRKREARDFDSDFRAATHVAEDGWIGIPAGAFRNGCVDACRLVGYKMTHAKLAVFVEADGIEADDGTPLVKLYGAVEMHVGPARNDNGSTDLRARPMLRRWGAIVTIRYDADMFTLTDVANLFSRVGEQVGIGEGRPNSRKSCGVGWGLFRIVKDDESAELFSRPAVLPPRATEQAA